MNIIVERLESSSLLAFRNIVDWNYHWWGIRNGDCYEKVEMNMAHSLNTGNKLPQTYIAYLDGKAA